MRPIVFFAVLCGLCFCASALPSTPSIAAAQPPCCHECKSPKNKYFSIADDSGPWLCGETCIRDGFYPIFHLFEKNLTKAKSNTVCADAGYTKYNQTVTHGGGGLTARWICTSAPRARETA